MNLSDEIARAARVLDERPQLAVIGCLLFAIFIALISSAWHYWSP